MNVVRRRLLRFGAMGSLALAGSAVYVALTPPRDEVDETPTNPDRAQPLPQFALQGPDGSAGLSTAEITGGGRPVLLNVFASWCAPCAVEVPVLMSLRDHGVRLWGIAFRDRVEAVQSFLDRFGNPFERIGVDQSGNGTVGLNLTGVPENLLVDGAGMIRWRWPAGITPEMVQEEVLPRWRGLVA